MKREALAIIEQALQGQPITSKEAELATEALGKLRQQQWALQVLIEWAKEHTRVLPSVYAFEGTWRAYVPGHANGTVPGRWHTGATPHGAMLMAARELFPRLRAETRDELGECP